MDDDISSTCSQFSQISFRGEEEVDAERAVDQSVKDIQTGLNQINVCLRNLLMCDERDDDYTGCITHANMIFEMCKDGKDLYKDIIGITKQLLPKKPADYKPPIDI